MGPNVAWLAGLSPWPEDGFGTGRMERLLARLGDPQRGLRAIHVVGTNGKTTTTRMCEALLLAEGLVAGCTTSPHIKGWEERVRVGGREVDLERVLASVREAAEEERATQFETLTAAALLAFHEGRVDAAAIEAGLGGRLDATNVLDGTPVVVLTNVGLEHTDVLGSTRAAIAREKLAVVHEGSTVVLGEPEWEDLAWVAGAGAVLTVAGDESVELAAAAVEALLGRDVGHEPARAVTVPGRLERLDGEIRDGAHNPDGVRWLVDRLRGERFTLCVSVLRDKDVESMLGGLAELGSTVVATASSNARVLPAAELADRAGRHFPRVECVPDPVDAVARAHELGEPVLVTGSLYLLADLASAEGRA